MRFFSWRSERRLAGIVSRLTESRRRLPRPRGWRLFVEQLEDRLTPASVSWTGGAGTFNWTDANNWSGLAVPGAADDVTISTTVTSPITISSGTQSINSLTDTSAALVLSGGSLSLAASSSTNKNLTVSGGTLTPSGGLTVSSATVNFNGGTSGGTVTILSGTLAIGAGSTGAGNFVLQGADTLSGTVAAAQTLWVQGSSNVGFATLTTSGNVTNHGTIRMESVIGSYTDTLSIGNNTITNAADGIIQVNAGSGGARAINGNLTNLGSVNVGAATYLAVNSSTSTRTFINQGQTVVDPAGYMTVGSIYNAAGGTITGPGYVHAATLLITASPASPTTILVDSNSFLTSNVLANTTVWVQGNNVFGASTSATLNSSAGLTNHGTILLQSINSASYTSTLDCTSGTFTNAADGTIQVGAGSGGGRVIVGTFTNLGAVSVAAGIQLAVNGSRPNGTFTNQGQVAVDAAGYMTVGDTYNAAGGTITGPGYVHSGILNVTASPPSPTTILVDGSSYLTSDVLPNTTVWVQGNNVFGANTYATLAPSAGLTNHGTILLQSINGASYTDTLDCTSGTFTNAVNGTIQASAGSGGSRTITGTLTNLGSVTVSAGTYLAVNNGSRTATVVNQGQVVVDPAGLLTFGQTYNAAGGTISGPGYVFNGTLSITASPASPTTILVAGSSTLATNVLSSTTVWIQGNNALGLNTYATLSVAAGLTNHGTILLQSIDSNNYTDTLATGSNTFTNAADGTIQIGAGVGGSRLITGNLTNLGTVSVAAGIALTVNSGVANGTFTNQGQAVVDPAGFMTVGGTYYAAGGTISGPGYVYNGTLRVTASTPSPTTILVFGNSTLATDVLTNTTVWVQGNNVFGSNTFATLNTAAGLTNHGTILLQSINGSSYTDTLATGSNTFTNANDGVIQVGAGSGGSRLITGNLTNLGGVIVGAATSLVVNSGNPSGTFVNQGAVAVDPAGVMTVSGTYNAVGGTISGPGYVYNGTLSITANSVNPTTILVDGNSTLTTNVLPSFTVWVEGNNLFGVNTNATLNVAAGLTNHGTILMQSISGAYADTLAAGSGTFTNAADGTIQVSAGTGGGRFFTGTLTNLGTVNVGNGTTFAPSGAGSIYTQTSGATVLTSGTLGAAGFPVNINGGVLSGTGTVNGNVTNAGTVSLGTTPVPGQLTINGSYTQTAAGTLNLQIGGRTVAGQDYDQIVVNGTPPGAGTVTLAGTVNVSLVNGFTPLPGDRYQVINFASSTGDFATKNGFSLGGGNVLVEQFSAGNLALVVDQPPAITSASNATFTAGTAGSFTVTATGSPAPTFTETGALPSGVTLSSAGVLGGTPAAGTAGVYNLVITATNGVSPDATQNFTLNVTGFPTLAVTATADLATVTAGAAAGYTLTIANTGGATATGLTLSDPLPALGGGNAWTIDGGANQAAFTIAGAAGSQTLSLAAGVNTLAAGASLVVHVSGTTTPGGTPYTAALSTTATVDASNTTNHNVTATATITVQSPNVTVTETADAASIAAGSAAGYTVTVTNNGAGTATGLTLSDPLPALGGTNAWTIDGGANQAAFTVAGSAPTQTLTLATGVTTLAAGASLVVHVSGTTTTAGTLASTATANATNEFTHNQTGSASITVTGANLQVSQFTPSESGFHFSLNGAPVFGNLNVLPNTPGFSGGADVVVTGPVNALHPDGVYTGTLVQDAGDPTSFTWVATGDPGTGQTRAPATQLPLPAGTYTVKLVSGANAWTNATGSVLTGGAGDTNPGTNDYDNTFTVSTNRYVSVPNIVLGPGQPLSTDASYTSTANTGATGAGAAVKVVAVPLFVSAVPANANGLSFDLTYNPQLLTLFSGGANGGNGLTITAAGANLGMSSGLATLNPYYDTTNPNAYVARFGFALVNPTATSTPVSFATFAVRVPDGTYAVPGFATNPNANSSYGQKAVLAMNNLTVTTGSSNLSYRADNGVDVNAYVGDLSGDRQLLPGDASAAIQLYGAGVQNHGLQGFPLIDSVLIADATFDGQLLPADASVIIKEFGTPSSTSIPNQLPVGQTAASGPDPVLTVPTDLKALPGGVVNVPVNIDFIDRVTVGGVDGITLVLGFDNRVFDATGLSAAGVQLGSVLGKGWVVGAVAVYNADGKLSGDASGTIVISLYTSARQDFAPGVTGSVVVVPLALRPDAPAGATQVNLRADNAPYGAQATRITQNGDGRGIVLGVAPTDAAGDQGISAIDGRYHVVDGTVTVAPAAAGVWGFLDSSWSAAAESQSRPGALQSGFLAEASVKPLPWQAPAKPLQGFAPAVGWLGTAGGSLEREEFVEFVSDLLG
jgi:hypothetical protein